MATISSPMGRTPRNAGAGANTYKKGGTTKMAGVMKNGGTIKKKMAIGGVIGNPTKKAARIDNRIEHLERRGQRIGDADGMNKRQFERAGDLRKKRVMLTNKRNALTNYTEGAMKKSGGAIKKKK